MPPTLPPRRLILLAGPQDWGKQVVTDLITSSQLQESQYFWLEPEDKSFGLLGQDRALVIIDAYLGLNPDVIGRVSGLVQAGGALVLICPTFQNWPVYPDPETDKLTPYPMGHQTIPGFYLRRWVRVLKSLTGIEHYTVDDFTDIPVVEAKIPAPPLSEACTSEQQQAVDAICKTARGHRRRPALISASRGRGKSAALGLAAGKLLASRRAQTIIVTASSFNQVSSVFKHAQAVLPDAEMAVAKKCLQHAHGTLRYISADVLIECPEKCDLLIVDEASTLGVARLAAVLEHYPRVVFSGTEYGYEGSGRGFALKFKQLIEAHSRGQYYIKLKIPIRWTINDPLEYWINRLLLLDISQMAGETPDDIPIKALSFQAIEQSALAEDETLLTQVFGLLIDAHYQTRPVDARYLLDAPNSQLYAAVFEGQIIGLIWLMLEGGLGAGIAREIVIGRRRPQSHRVPQILAAHLGLEDAVTMRCARIQRIVVRPEAQGRGIGSWMITQVEDSLGNDIDYLASSFGINLALSNFWQRGKFNTIRLSDKLRAASGLHSAVVLKPISIVAEKLVTEAQALFIEQFIVQLSSDLNNLSSQLACQLVPQGADLEVLNYRELKTAVLFAYGKRPLESSLAVLTKIARSALLDASLVFDPDDRPRQLFIMRFLQHQPWARCAEYSGLSGQRKCTSLLRQGVHSVLSQRYPEPQITGLRSQYGLPV
jgi:tRNA(Met) cytidine acetyltransferase